MKMIICQSCGMPLNVNADHGTNQDGTINPDYCTYCYQEGKFTKKCTMDEMILICSEFTDEMNKNLEQKITKEDAIAYGKQLFPTLKRWSKA